MVEDLPNVEPRPFPRLWHEPVVVYQVLDPRGTYPRFSVLTETHSFYSSAEIVWSAVIQPPIEAEPWDRPEIYTLTPEEIRLIAAIALSESDPFDNGYMAPLYHRGATGRPGDLPTPLNSPDFASFMREQWQESREFSLHHAGDQSDALDLLQSIDSSDHLLIAGLGRLLSNLRLSAAGFDEEALYQAYVSMGAAMEFIRQHIEMEGDVRASYKQVYQYFESTFPFGEHFSEFLEMMYEDRITAFHPSSRFGEYWAPPVWVGTDFELRKWLMHIYRHIILGEVPQDVSAEGGEEE